MRIHIYELRVIFMNIEAYDAESLRRLVRLLEYENRILKENIRKLVNNPKFKTEIQKHIGNSIDTEELDREHTGLQERLKQVTGAKNKLANQMDNLSVSDKHYDKKYEDMQVRLDKLYDEIEEIETSIEAVETRLYNIKHEKISGDNVYQFLLFFDKLYDRFTDMEKKTFMKSFLEEVNIYEAEQEDGRVSYLCCFGGRTKR